MTRIRFDGCDLSPRAGHPGGRRRLAGATTRPGAWRSPSSSRPAGRLRGSASRCADSAVISAVTAPTVTRMRFADRDDARDRPLHVVLRRVRGAARETASRPTGRRSRRRRLLRRRSRGSRCGRRAPRRSACRRAAPRPCSTLPPAKRATNGETGAEINESASPSCTILPSTSTPTWSASAAASTKSCVTSSVGRPSSRSVVRNSTRTASRVCGSSAASGSSRRSTAGSRASARASATRCRSPPDKASGRAPARSAIRKRSSSSSTRTRPPNATFWRTLRCGKRAYSWNTRPTRRSSGGRETPAAASNHTSSPSAIRPSAGADSPAIARRIVLLPAPEGPTIASVPSTSSVSSTSKARSGSLNAAVRVSMRRRA